MIVSRGELIEIGDGFRIPDVLARSGARLVEVGTTNRTRAKDYERADRARRPRCSCACTSRTSASSASRSCRSSRSSPRSRGATGCRSSTTSARACSHELPGEPSARESLAAGADLVCFSGDKLLGGPQAGIVVGRADLVERLRRHPLQRAVRADKLTLAALEGTLRALPRRAGADSGAAHAARGRRRPCARARSGSPRSSAARSRRRSAASAAARCRSPSCRASRARSRSRSPRRCARASRRSSASCATGSCCSTAARSRDDEVDEVAAAVTQCR